MAGIVIVALCYRAVRDTINAASVPVRPAFSALVIAACAGMSRVQRLVLPLVLVKLRPALDR